MKILTTATVLTTALLIASSSAYAADGDMTQTRTQDRIQQHLNTDFDLYTPDASSLQTLNREQQMTRNQNRYQYRGMNGSADGADTEHGTGNMENNQARNSQAISNRARAEHSMQASSATRSMNTYRNSNMTRSMQSNPTTGTSTMTQQNTASRSMSGNRR